MTTGSIAALAKYQERHNKTYTITAIPPLQKAWQRIGLRYNYPCEIYQILQSHGKGQEAGGGAEQRAGLGQKPRDEKKVGTSKWKVQSGQ